jgi:hypothetical protein
VADEQYDTLQLVGLHRPDTSVETDETGRKFTVDLPGTYSFGALIGGQFVELYSMKAGNIVDAIAAAKGKQSEPETEPAPAEPAA